MFNIINYYYIMNIGRYTSAIVLVNVRICLRIKYIKYDTAFSVFKCYNCKYKRAIIN